MVAKLCASCRVLEYLSNITNFVDNKFLRSEILAFLVCRQIQGSLKKGIGQWWEETQLSRQKCIQGNFWGVVEQLRVSAASPTAMSRFTTPVSADTLKEELNRMQIQKTSRHCNYYKIWHFLRFLTNQCTTAIT